MCCYFRSMTLNRKNGIITKVRSGRKQIYVYIKRAHAYTYALTHSRESACTFKRMYASVYANFDSLIDCIHSNKCYRILKQLLI